MNLRFNLKTISLIEIDGDEMSAEGDELYIDGVHAPSVLDQMMSQYEEIGIGVRTSALHIADLVFNAGQSIDEATARVIAQDMALLAHDLLLEEGAGKWEAQTLFALMKIRITDPDVATLGGPDEGTPAQQDPATAMRAMTIGQLLDLMDPEEATSESWGKMEKVLGLILEQAANFYGGVGDFIGAYALAIGLCVAEADGIEKDDAANIVANMEELVNFMLDAEGVKEWSPETVARLKAIRDTNPDVRAEPEAVEAAE